MSVPDADADIIKNDSHWKKGDVTLISSDLVRFRVPSFFLYSSSTVFADILSFLRQQHSEMAIELTDNDFERATIIRAYLDLISCRKGRLPFAKATRGWQAVLVSLIRFLNKYNSQSGVEQLRAYGAELALVSRDLEPEDAFVYAAHLNDLALCVAILDTFKEWTWRSDENDDRTDDQKALCGTNGEHLFSLDGAPFHFAVALPAPYQWALCRAAGKVAYEDDPQAFCTAFKTNVCFALKELKKDPGKFLIHVPFPPIVRTATIPREFGDNE